MATRQNPHGLPTMEEESLRVAEMHHRMANAQSHQESEAHLGDMEGADEYEDDEGEGTEILSDDETRGWAVQNQAEGDQDLDVDIHDEEAGEYDEYDEMEDTAPVFDPAALALKEINNLAHFSVSSHKPGNGVAELLSDDLDKFWQSDGQQPHLLTMHFLRRVEIRAIRFYVDYVQDESYTPIHVLWYAGTGHHDLMQFGEQGLSNPTGWQEVEIEGLGGGHDGNSLCCFIVQMHIKENHQNGKDTHIRGIKIYALDENAPRRDEDQLGEIVESMGAAAAASGGGGGGGRAQAAGVRRAGPEDDFFEDTPGGAHRSLRDLPAPAGQNQNTFITAGLSMPDFVREPEIR